MSSCPINLIFSFGQLKIKKYDTTEIRTLFQNYHQFDTNSQRIEATKLENHREVQVWWARPPGGHRPTERFFVQKALCHPIENLVLRMNYCRWLCPEVLQSRGARPLDLFPTEIDAVTRVCFLPGATSAQFSGLGGDLTFAVLSVCPDHLPTRVYQTFQKVVRSSPNSTIRVPLESPRFVK